ncbi:ArsR/SmtB family transcription factor [Tuwongella immobilis]|uniref:HTH arsR-type domain-containing protein n=1 Tax=Tuwongella immobilis TaxID=692036 RepID=A0A6C2YHP3_9BACT|nr:metalloregulator ArsR/SmtB family transcription factor [Tuwongella immobilis]VIP00937.1 family transcriptional regulator : Transcriptional regulator, ArsR family OS=Pirellula staleyi (strain ATCC 27377 / DSM 6068 / ICPB 4128) GN=Psta_0460 PE=4 SV=1: HTH_20 [Tuwongella immobilis]VTR97292.1 family transcriptional regulator : Transcriptional regulator, ArsR family OS=Pirellula staleyi (strain ATCC 27377 / DSM 6068 / ICPB 4128) GN=Psta_0460 PE=4 SV=1: HTH_20 [Tuwongella immobilis]
MSDNWISLDRMNMAAECLKTLAHPHRLRIVEMLLEASYTVGELADACGIPSNIASGHLRLMQRCGLLAPERDGRNVYYKITEPCLKDFMTCIRKRFASGEGG